MLDGCRILVLQNEPLVALDLLALFEAEGAVVSTRCGSDARYDCFIIDSIASNKPLTELAPVV